MHALVDGLTTHGHMTTSNAELLVETLIAAEEPAAPVHAAFKHVSDGPLHASSESIPVPGTVAGAAWLDKLLSAAPQEVQPRAKQLI